MADRDELAAEAEVRNGASGTTSEEELSEALDEDKLAGGGSYPPDQPAASFDYGVTPQGQRVPEPIAERVQREKPEQSFVGEEGRVGRLVAPDEGVGPDDEGTEVAREVDRVADHDRPVGDVGTSDTTTYDVAPELGQDVSAEEAAVHERDVP
ncbi:hypothetical protein NHL50_05130 [Acidimicrobiia bacterium EGI L10123]|uniref:hypothetical protein n=1 Tax=Salinilacustrithrix flava TaxID=2957203 RepID=UPI003D7C1E0D|nr:hypothetical protein [Acidimicrobiia bacterium EGI L10123]